MKGSSVRVQLGNPAPKEGYRDGEGNLLHRDLDGPRVTTIVIPDSYTLMEAVSAVVAADGAWNHHTQGDIPQDVRPDWIECDHEALSMLLSSHFGCPVRRPEGYADEPVSAVDQTEPATDEAAANDLTKAGESDPR